MKQKTHKALTKRFKLTKRGKVLKRKAGNDHFNSKESGKTRRNKRRDIRMPKSMEKAVANLLEKR